MSDIAHKIEMDAGQIRPLAIANWLLFVAFMVFLIIIVGGITRLTESGLSITQWNVVSGTLPPLSDVAWQSEFVLYQATTEFQMVNGSMTLEQFKLIYFWEYFHRLVGRLIGLAFALPFVWFAVKRVIPRGYHLRLVALLALGALQGAIGWWMVSSGLTGRTDVSHYRLAIHLLNALFVFGGLIWTALDLKALARDPAAKPARLQLFAIATLLILAIQLLLGAYTAGLNAGYAFSSWPKMGDEWFPAATIMLEPAWRNLIDNPIVVQFVHRWFAFVAALVLAMLAMRAWRSGDARAAIALFSLLVLQILLGIFTLLTGVEIWIAVAHQAVAALLVAAAVVCAHRIDQIR